MVELLLDSLNIAAALYLAMAVYTLTRPPSITNRLLFLIMFICTVWAVSYHQELTASSVFAKLAWMKGRHFFLVFLTALWFMLSAKLAGVAKRASASAWCLLFVIPVLTLPIALTMDSHDWFRHDFSVSDGEGPRPLLFSRGPWCLVYDLYQLALQLVGLLLLVRALRTLSPVLRRPIALLIVSSLLPIIANFIFNKYAASLMGLNPAPLILMPAAVILAIAVFRFQLLHVAPVARDMLFDHIHDGIIVTDLANHVVDMNTAAENMLGLSVLQLSDQTSASAPAPWPNALGTDDDPTQAFCSDSANDGPWYERTRIPILTSGRPIGWMFIFQDITAQMILHRQRISKVRSEEEGKRARQWSLLLRDLHDGIGAVSANIGLLAELGRKAEKPEAKDALFAQIADLANEGNLEVRTMMNSLETRSLTWAGLFAEIRHYASLVLEPRDIRFTLTVSGESGDEPDFGVSTSIFRIVKEALANTAKHAQATRVTVDFLFDASQLKLVIRDDGCWKEGRPEGRGLRHLRLRVQDLGGTFLLETAPSTQLTCLLPRLAEAPRPQPPSKGSHP